jgi:hypothetical protein
LRLLLTQVFEFRQFRRFGVGFPSHQHHPQPESICAIALALPRNRGSAKMSKSGTMSVCGLIAGPLLGLSLSSSSALAAACTIAPVSTYTATGFSCSVGPVTFSNIVVAPTTTGSGTVALTEFSPFMIDGNYGLHLIYTSSTGFSGGTADVAWTYDVSGKPPLDDAYASLTGSTAVLKPGASALISLGETLSNGKTLTLSSAGATSTTFAPVPMLDVTKDQQNTASPGAIAMTSIMGNAFSVVPEPSTWAMLLLGFAGLGLVGYKRAGKLRAAA